MTTAEAVETELSTSVEIITPESAAELLEGNVANRHLRPALISRYAHDMRNGNWHLNGEPLLFNGDGRLLNGQHRLEACIEAGVPFQTLVIRGVATEAMPTIDTGDSRTLGDYLGIEGMTNASVVAAIVGWAMRYDAMVVGGQRQLHRPNTSRSDQLRYVEQYQRGLAYSAKVVIASRQLLLGAPSIYGFAHFIGTRDGGQGRRKLDEFIAYCCDPAGLEPTEAPVLLRHTMLRIQSQSIMTKPGTTAQAALVMKSVRHWLRDDRVKLLKWGRGQGKKGSKLQGEPFPRVADSVPPLPWVD